MIDYQNIKFLEFHDAHLENIIISSGGKLMLEFECMTIFFKDRVEDDRDYVSLTLEVTGVTFFSLDGPFPDTDYVTVGSLNSIDPNDGNTFLLPFDEKKAIKGIDLLLAGSGTNIKITANFARISHIELLEDE